MWPWSSPRPMVANAASSTAAPTTRLLGKRSASPTTRAPMASAAGALGRAGAGALSAGNAPAAGRCDECERCEEDWGRPGIRSLTLMDRTIVDYQPAFG